MRRGRQRIYGGSGALPLWTDFVKDIIHNKMYKNHIDPYDLNILSKKSGALNNYRALAHTL